MYNKSFIIGGISLSVETPCDYTVKEPYKSFMKKRDDYDILLRISFTKEFVERRVHELYCKKYFKAYKIEEFLYRDYFYCKDIKKSPYAYASVREKKDEISRSIEVIFSKEYQNNLNDKLIFDVMDLPHLLTVLGGVLLHASYIAINGEAILFVAPKGIGKSTQANLWNKYRGAEIINGDRVCARKVNNLWMAHGVPYSGTSGICKNKSYPIKAIIFISQGIDNEVKQPNRLDSYKLLLKEASYNTWDKEDLNFLMDTIMEVSAVIPLYKFNCRADESAVKALEEVLWEKET